MCSPCCSRTDSISQAGLKHTDILLTLPPECWDQSHVPHAVFSSLWDWDLLKLFGYLYCKLPMNAVATGSAIYSATEATKTVQSKCWMYIVLVNFFVNLIQTMAIWKEVSEHCPVNKAIWRKFWKSVRKLQENKTKVLEPLFLSL